MAIDGHGNEQVGVEECGSKREATETAEKLRIEVKKIGARNWARQPGLPGSYW
jgi:hypothetical protein